MAPPAALAVVSSVATNVVNFVTSNVSPWMMAGLFINYASNIESYKKAASLIFQVLTGSGESAKCSLCTELVDRMMDLTGASDSVELSNRIDCGTLCPFKLRRCMKLCARLVEASKESATFPCVAIKMCPVVDQFGEVPRCAWDWKTAACTPAFVCERTRTFPFPQCGMNEGYAKWRQASGVVQAKAGALFHAVRSLRPCSDPEADPHFCVKEAEGIGLFCEYLGWAIVCLVAPLQSVRAIETPGGGDDRQWLAFWIMFFLFSIMERFTLVMLSKFEYYYVFKLLALCWLSFWEGASHLYLYVHRSFTVVHRFVRRNQSVRLVCAKMGVEKFLETQEEQTQAECLEEYEEAVKLAALGEVVADAKRLGSLQVLFEELTSAAAVRAKYSESVLHALKTKWNEREFRFLEIDLISASDLPVMDFAWGGEPMKADPFAVFYLVPPAKDGGEALSRSGSLESSFSLDGLVNLFGGGAGEPSRAVTEDDLIEELTGKDATSSPLAALARGLKTGHFALSRSSKLLGFHSGPAGSERQYGRTVSRVIKQSLNPEWNQLLEVELQGGQVDAAGNFINKDTPFTALRVEVWDWDQFSNCDFIGEATIPLSPLMTGTTYAVERALEDPEKVSAASEVGGRIRLNLRYTS